MDMDFLTDFTDLHQADLIGSIDNETVETFIPDNFIQGVAFVDNIADNNSNNTAVHSNAGQSQHNGTATSNALATTKAPSTTATGTLTTISAHVSVTSTPIGTPTTLALSQATTQPQLPESPPDSGSEPPYSPLQETHGGLTLTARETFNAGLPHELQFSAQYITTTQSHTHHQPQQHHYTQSPASLESMRLKHESGLIINPTTLLQSSHQQPLQYNMPPSHETHIDMSQQHLLYANNNIMHYDPPPYPTNASYAEPLANASICATILNDMAHVEVVGTQTPRTSAPSTPVHNTRKRKMSTQLDYVEYPNIKSDPGLKMSPTCTTGSDSLATRVASTSPASIQNEILATPAHSSASLSPAPSTVNSNNDNSMDGSANGQSGNVNADPNADPNAMSPCIRFTPFQPQNWHKLCDQRLQDLSVVYYRVDADKGFNYSVSDEAFVCQKKNHFQITCHARLQADAKFVKTPSGIEKIKAFHLHFYGVKLEAPNQTIRVEQSQSDRSKKPFFPVPIDLQCHIVSKITVGRLHFSETTNNNMRKKGRPNPEQRYFQLVVALHVHTASGNYPVISQASERIIVRASNPGQFESDVELCWQRGLTQDSIFHAGRVGINTDRPDESLVVHGNLKISGHIVQPSDSRAKREISELDTSVQLRNLQKIRIVRYRYEPEFAIHSGLKRGSSSDSEEIVDTGVIAQEVREVIPDAVQEAGSVVLPNGNVIENFLLVNKDRILMENIGAVKELCKQTGALTNRVEYLERVNTQLVRSKEFEQAYLRTNAKMCSKSDGYEICSNRTLQIFIVVLVIVMAICLAAVSTIYFLEHNQRQNNILKLEKLYFGQKDQEHYYLQHYQYNRTHHPCQSSISNSSTTTTTRPPSLLDFLKPKLHEELVNNDAPRNDEHDVYGERGHFPPPLIAKHINHITTSAPVLRNKTISRNKLKYTESLPNEVPSLKKLASAAVKRHQNLNDNTTAAAEKPVEPVLLPQDFENNSIDIDAQQLPRKPSVATNKLNAGVSRSGVARDAHASPTLAKTVITNQQPHVDIDFNDANNADEIVQIVQHIASTISSNNHVPPPTITSTSSTSLAQREALILYKTVSPPTEVQLLNTNNVASERMQRNYSIETPAITNHSKGSHAHNLDNPDANDLQVLSATNETVDNPITALFGIEVGPLPVRESALGRRSTPDAYIWAAQSIKHVVEIFGEPADCATAPRHSCQSTCSISDSTLATPAEQQQTQMPLSPQNVDTALNLASLEDEQSEPFKPKPNVMEAPKLTQSDLNAQTKNQTLHDTDEEADDSDEIDAETSELKSQILEIEPLDVQAKLASIPKVMQNTPKQLAPKLKNANCYRVTGTILANTQNRTFGMEEYCPEADKAMQVTYIIPISRYLIVENIELHLSYSKPLHWHLCKNNVLTANTSNMKLINTQTHQQHNSANVIQQRQGYRAILFVDIPQQGAFEREIILRAVNDTKTQNVCSDSTTLAAFTTRLQYNFRILRNCD